MMSKPHIPFLLLFFLSFLVGCTDSKTTILTQQQLQQQLQQLNVALQSTASTNTASANTASANTASTSLARLPFSEAYLARRHELLNSQLSKPDATPQKELNYLKIQERYPERFYLGLRTSGIKQPNHLCYTGSSRRLANADQSKVGNRA